MEWMAKLAITVIVFSVGWKALHLTWTSHIDVPATFAKYFGKKSALEDALVVRDSKKLYQNGKAVADVTGTVKITGTTVLFEQLANVTALDITQTVEYLRLKVGFTGVQRRIGMKTVISEQGSTVLQSVMEGVTSEQLND